MAGSVTRLAAIGDMHCSKDSRGQLRPLFAQAAEAADALLLCGDLTDYGQPEEAQILIDELGGAGGRPVVAVLGNHDYETGHAAELVAILSAAGVHLLDGDVFEVNGVGIAGIKGFGGGFGRGTLGAWGEPMIKAFVQEAIDEALKLESALARLRTPRRVAMLHYAPVRGTVENEPVEIFPWLGCGRLEEPLTRYPVDVAVHGHAHNGTFRGATAAGIPVFNVSLPLLRKTHPDRPPFHLIELSVDA